MHGLIRDDEDANRHPSLLKALRETLRGLLRRFLP
jgi:hypothetical protein